MAGIGRYKPGESGNPGGGKKQDFKGRRLVARALVEYHNGDDDAFAALAARVWEKALKSDSFPEQQWATEFIADRVDGRPHQAIVGGDPETDAPVQISNTLSEASVEIVRRAIDSALLGPATKK